MKNRSLSVFLETAVKIHPTNWFCIWFWNAWN